MRRALGEYLIAGIKTTIPFFMWLLDQPEFLDGRFHTTYLDEVLRSRNGRPFLEPAAGEEETATIAAVIHAVLASGDGRKSGAGGDVVAGRWRAQARSEAVNK